MYINILFSTLTKVRRHLYTKCTWKGLVLTKNWLEICTTDHTTYTHQFSFSWRGCMHWFRWFGKWILNSSGAENSKVAQYLGCSHLHAKYQFIYICSLHYAHLCTLNQKCCSCSHCIIEPAKERRENSRLAHWSVIHIHQVRSNSQPSTAGVPTTDPTSLLLLSPF